MSHLNLPEDNPYTPVIKALLLLAVIKAVALTIIAVAAVWLVKHLRSWENGVNRVLELAEANAKLGKDRRDDAKSEVIERIEQAKDEIKKEVPKETVKILDANNSGIIR